MRSTLGSNLVNEARVGYSGAPVNFFAELNPGMFTGIARQPGGLPARLPDVGSGLTSPSAGAAPQSRNANSLLIEDTLTWLKGSHSLTLGGSFTQFDVWAKNSNARAARSASACCTNDPANALFTAANFPGASAAQT